MQINCKTNGGCNGLQISEFVVTTTTVLSASLCPRLLHCKAISDSPSSLHMQATDKAMQQRVAVALAWLGKEADLRLCFVDRKGLDVLLELLTDQRRDTASHKEAAGEMLTI